MLMRFAPFVVHETPADAGAAAVEPVVEPAPVVPAPPAEPTSPWASDLATAFQDDAERARVDTFMREKYQPYVTQLETSTKPARELYDSLQGENSLESYLGLAEQLYGEDIANLLAETIIEKYAAGDDAATPAEPAPTDADAPLDLEKLPPEIRTMYEEREAEKAQKHYWSEMDRVKAADARVDQDLFHPFVVGAGGDFDAALGQYQAWHAKAYPAAPPAEVPTPPATLTDGHPAPPTAQKFDSLDAAMDFTLDEMRAARQQPPTTVGTA